MLYDIKDEVVKMLQSETESYFDVQRYVVLNFLMR